MSEADLDDIRMPPATCPRCGYEMDCATALEEGTTPSPGDYSLCIECGDLNAFDDALQLRAVPLEELIALPLREREYLLRIEETSKRLIAERKRG